MEPFALNSLDYIIIAGYFLLFTVLAFFIRAKSLKTYWTNDRGTNTTLLTLSAVSTIIGAGAVFGVCAMAYSGGLAPFFLAGSYAFGLLLLGFLAPRLRTIAEQHNLYSLPDFLETFFSRRCRLIGATIQLFVYFFFLAGQLVALGTLCNVIIGLSVVVSLGAAVILVLVYTLMGGIRMDIIADNIQFVIMSLLFILLPAAVWDHGTVMERITQLPTDFLLGQGVGGWPFIIGLFIILPPGVLVAGDCWMRIYSAKSPEAAKKSFIISAFLVFLFVCLAAFIGLAARATFPDLDPDASLMHMVAHYIPPGMLGLIIAGLLAAILSSADSMLLVSGMAITNDLVAPFISKLHNSERKMLLTTRCVNVGLLLSALLLALALPDIVKIVVNATSVLVVLSPAVLHGLFAKKRNEPAAFWSLSCGLAFTFVGFWTMPNMPYIPGIGMSLVVFAALSVREKWQRKAA